jgi:aminoglycoside phosphotransferase (APT) family kinase protein
VLGALAPVAPVPRVLACLPDPQDGDPGALAVCLERVPGAPLGAGPAADPAEELAAARLAWEAAHGAAAEAALRTLAADLEDRRPYRAHAEARVEAAAARLGAPRPVDVAALLDQAAATLRELGERLDAARVPPVLGLRHGAWRGAHLLAGGPGGRVAVVDWEEAGLGDPLQDLGTLTWDRVVRGWSARAALAAAEAEPAAGRGPWPRVRLAFWLLAAALEVPPPVQDRGSALRRSAWPAYLGLVAAWCRGELGRAPADPQPYGDPS